AIVAEDAQLDFELGRLHLRLAHHRERIAQHRPVMCQRGGVAHGPREPRLDLSGAWHAGEHDHTSVHEGHPQSGESAIILARMNAVELARGARVVAGPLAFALVWLLVPAQYAAADGTTGVLPDAGRATLAMMAWMAAWWL